MNVPAQITDGASGLLDPEHRQSSEYLKQLKSLVDEQANLRAALEEERQVTAEKYAKLDIEFAQREVERRNQFENELARVIREFNDESAQLLNTVKDKVAAARLKKEAEARAAELRRSAAVRLRKQQASAPTPVTPTTSAQSSASSAAAIQTPASALLEEVTEVREGDRVRIKSFDKEATVETINDGVYTVIAGSLRFRLKRDELQLVKSAAPPASKRAASLPRGVSASIDVDDNFTSELNVIGTTVDEATERVDKYLDDAFLAGVESVRIVHGHGTGALKRAIATLLKGHPHVERFGDAPANQGGGGATIIALRK